MPNKNRNAGLGLPSLLLLIFIILKLTHVIDWSWLWVLSPLWIAASLALLFFVVIGVIILAAIIGIMRADSNIVYKIKGMFRKSQK